MAMFARPSGTPVGRNGLADRINGLDMKTSSLADDSMSPSSNPTASTHVMCILCQELLKPDSMPALPGCPHVYCKSCLGRMESLRSLATPTDSERTACLLCRSEKDLISNGPVRTAEVTGCQNAEMVQSNLHLCKSCSDDSPAWIDFAGKIPPTTNHTEREQAPSMRIRCGRHKSEAGRYFCTVCIQTVCDACISAEPCTGHRCISLPDGDGDRAKGALMETVGQMRAKVKDLAASLHIERKYSSRFLTQYCKAKMDVETTLQYYFEVLNERRQQIAQEMDNLYAARIQIFGRAQHELQSTLDKLEEVIKLVCDTLAMTCRVDYTGFSAMIQDNLRELLNYQPPPGLRGSLDSAGGDDIRFVSEHQLIPTAVQNTFGHVRYAETGCGSSRHVLHLESDPAYASSLDEMAFTDTTKLNFCSDSFKSYQAGNVETSWTDLYSVNSRTIEESNSILQAVGLNMPSLARPTQFSSSIRNANGMLSSAGSVMEQHQLPKLIGGPLLKREKMAYHCKFGEFGSGEGQFTEPSGLATNAANDILVADTNNHRIEVFDCNGVYRHEFRNAGRKEGDLAYPIRLVVSRATGEIIVAERSPTHQVQIFNATGNYVRRFGSMLLQHPRGVAVDSRGRIIVVECKVMRVFVFDSHGSVLSWFRTKELEFPNCVAVNDKEEIFISDNRAHCVKVFY